MSRNASRESLSREAIVKAALDVLNESGLDSLTTRRLAERLGVKSPALYWHFRNKQDLIDAIGDEIALAAGMGEPRPGEDWASWLERRARSYRQQLLAHRDGARVVAGKNAASEAVQAAFEREIEAMCGFGFDEALAVRTVGTISHYVTGFVLDEQHHEHQQDSPLGSRDEDSFSHGLRVILLGTGSLIDGAME